MYICVDLLGEIGDREATLRYGTSMGRGLSWRLPFLSCLVLQAQAGFDVRVEVDGKMPSARPQPKEHARMARWLVHVSDWGTVSTQSTMLEGFPYGNAVAISDGPQDKSTGRIIFYLTDFDQTAVDLKANPKATLNLCEAQRPGECVSLDPEDPRCSKVTITGEIFKVPEEEIEIAKELMFRRHRQMRDWHAHTFTLYEMHIGNIKLLDYYGGYDNVEPEAYFAAWMVLEEMKSDPCWRYPHRFYCVEDRFEVKKQQTKRALTQKHRRPEPAQ